MATDVERLAVLIEANTKSYENAMRKLQSSTERALRNSQKSVDGLNARLKGLQSTVTKVAGVFGVAFGARALVGFIKSSVEAGEATGDLAERLGITAEQLQEFTFAAEQNGSSQEGLATAFRGMTKLLGEVERGSKQAKAELAALGLTAADLRNKSPADVFTTLLDRIGRIEDPLRRNAELNKIFGKSGLEMAQLAMQGAKGIDALRDRARELGLVLSNETIDKLQEAGDRIDVIKTAASTAGARMTEAFLPAIASLEAMVTSPEFQDGLAKTAAAIGAIVKFLADNPEIAAALAGAAVGYRVAGLPGAVVGAGAKPLFDATTHGAKAIDEALSRSNNAFGNTIPKTTSELMNSLGISKPLEIGVGTNKNKGTGGGFGGGFSSPEADALKKKYDELTRSLELQLSQLTMNARQQAISNEVAKLGAEATDRQKGAIAALTAKLYDSKLATESFRSALESIGEKAFDAFGEVLSGAKSAGDAIKELLLDLIAAEAKSQFMNFLNPAAASPGPLSALLGGLFGGFRASGGDVSPGKVYGVGERGPEIFVPRTPGRIVPNGAGMGGATRIIVEAVPNPYFDVRVRQVSGDVAKQTVASGLSGYDKGLPARMQMRQASEG